MTTTRALQQRIEAAIDHVFEQWRTGLGDQRPQTAITTAVLAEIAPVFERVRRLADEARTGAPWTANCDNIADQIITAIDAAARPAATQATDHQEH